MISRPLRVMVVDDNPETRAGLCGLLEALGACIIGEAENGRSGVEQALLLNPELILLDVSMPVMGGFAAARELRHLMPRLLIIFVSHFSDRAYAEEALEIGASGYVLKRTAGCELEGALDAVIAGGTFVSPGAARQQSGLVRN